MRQWYTMYTQPHKEVVINRQLEAKGIETYFPHLQVDRGYRRGIRLEPLFPNYLFFRANLRSNEAYGLQSLPGLRAIVHSANGPIVVPDEVIALLRKRLEPQTGKLLNRGDLFHPGQELRIEGGLFDGLEAVFCKGLSGRDRAQIFLKYLTTWTKVEIPYEQLRPHSHASSHVS